MVRFAPFFFFFFFEFQPKSGRFGRFGRYRPIPVDIGRYWPISADTADADRVGPIWVASALILAASARFGNRHVALRGTDAQSAASLPRRRVPQRQTRVCSPGSRVRASQSVPHPYNTISYRTCMLRQQVGLCVDISKDMACLPRLKSLQPKFRSFHYFLDKA